MFQYEPDIVSLTSAYSGNGGFNRTGNGSVKEEIAKSDVVWQKDRRMRLNRIRGSSGVGSDDFHDSIEFIGENFNRILAPIILMSVEKSNPLESPIHLR
jgi:hypothetical protein